MGWDKFTFFTFFNVEYISFHIPVSVTGLEIV